MNKRMKELHAKITAKLSEAQEVKSADPEKAKSLMKEIAELQDQYNLEKSLSETGKALAAAASAEETKKTVPEEPEKELSADEVVAKQVKALLRPHLYANDKNLSDTVSADGGYTVPVDAVYTINKYRETAIDLSKEVTVEKVSTRTGTRTYQKKGTPGAFAKLTANGMGYKGASGTDPESNLVANPTFEQLEYAIEDYAGYMPVPNNLLADSDADITALVYEWLGKASVDTDNAEILSLLGQSGTSGMGTGWTDFVGLDGIKEAVNVTLDQAYADTAKIYTNADGAQFLATLKEKSDSNKPLLTPMITDPAKPQLSVGFKALPVVVLPNKVMKSIAATASAGGKIPVIIGDLHEAIVKYDRQLLDIAASSTASVGGTNAFATNQTVFRGIVRADYVIKDADAIVKGYIGTPKKSA